MKAQFVCYHAKSDELYLFNWEFSKDADTISINVVIGTDSDEVVFTGNDLDIIGKIEKQIIGVL